MTGYKIVLELPARFGDTDALGHVNNASYLSYLEEARIEYLRRLFGLQDFRKIGVILARVEIDYRSPAYAGETLVVGIKTTRIGGASFDAGYTIEEKRTGRLVAEAKTVQVWFDYEANKVARIPADVAARMREFDQVP